MKMKIVLFVSFCFLMVSCAKKTDVEELPQIVEVEFEQISLPEDIFGFDYMVYNDSILIVVKRKHPDPYYVHVYSMNTWKELAHYYSRGNGPGELLSINAFLNDGRLIVTDYQNFKCSYLHMDSVVMMGDAYQPRLEKFDVLLSHHECWLDDSTIMISNGCYLDGYIENDSTLEFLKYTVGGNEKYYSQEKYNVFNVTGSVMAVNEEKQRIIVGGCTQPKIRLMDYDFNVLKEYMVNEYEKPEYYMSEYGDVTSDERNYNYSIFSATKANAIMYNLNHNNVNRKSNPLKIGGDRYGYTIEFFDWEANMLERITCTGFLVNSLSYSDESSTLYVGGETLEGEQGLFKYVRDEK